MPLEAERWVLAPEYVCLEAQIVSFPGYVPKKLQPKLQAVLFLHSVAECAL